MDNILAVILYFLLVTFIGLLVTAGLVSLALWALPQLTLVEVMLGTLTSLFAGFKIMEIG